MLIASRLQSLNLILAGLINIRHFFADILHLGRGDTTNRTQARYADSLYGALEPSRKPKRQVKR